MGCFRRPFSPTFSSVQHIMRAAILGGTLWLRIQEGDNELLYWHERNGLRRGLSEHIVILNEVKVIADRFGEDVPTLLSKTFNVDLHAAWRELTQPQELFVN